MKSVLHGSWKDLQSHYLNALSQPWYRSLIELQDALSVSTFQFFSGRGLRAVHLPLSTHSISSPMGLGSDSLPVQVELCGVKTYLADSMQFLLEYGTRLTKSTGCYYLMPSFRGEAADERHLCQFYHSEAEIPGSLDDVIVLVEDYLRDLSAAMLERCGDIIEQCAGTVSHIQRLIAHREAFPRVTFENAISLLADTPGAVKRWPDGFRTLTNQGEQKLIEMFEGFVWVSEFDHESVPFYQARTGDGRYAKAADLLMGIGETVGSGERHTSGDDVRQALADHRVDAEPYEWYINMKERYPLRTSGFGMGIERYLLWLLKHDDIRDCQLLPRFNGEHVIP